MPTKADFIVVSKAENIVSNDSNRRVFSDEKTAIEIAEKFLIEDGDDEVYVYRLCAVVDQEYKTRVEKVK